MPRYDPAVSVVIPQIQGPIFERQLQLDRSLSEWSIRFGAAEEVHAALERYYGATFMRTEWAVYKELAAYLKDHLYYAPGTVPSALAAISAIPMQIPFGETKEALFGNGTGKLSECELVSRPARSDAEREAISFGFSDAAALRPVVCITRNAGQKEWYYGAWALYIDVDGENRFIGVYCPLPRDEPKIFFSRQVLAAIDPRDAYWVHSLDHFASIQCAHSGVELAKWGRIVNSFDDFRSDNGVGQSLKFPSAGAGERVVKLRERERARRRDVITPTDTMDAPSAKTPGINPSPRTNRRFPVTILSDPTFRSVALSYATGGVWNGVTFGPGMDIAVPRSAALALTRAQRFHVVSPWTEIDPILATPVASCVGPDGIREFRAIWLSRETDTVELRSGTICAEGDEVVGVEPEVVSAPVSLRRSQLHVPNGKVRWVRPSEIQISRIPLALHPPERSTKVEIVRNRTGRFHQNLEIARRFAAANGHLRPIKQDRPEGLNLYMWLKNQEIRIAKGTLQADRLTRLEAIPEWVERVAAKSTTLMPAVKTESVHNYHRVRDISDLPNRVLDCGSNTANVIDSVEERASDVTVIDDEDIPLQGH